MAFKETTKMEQRRQLAALVLGGELNLSEAARRFGVSRPTARLWVRRAQSEGLANMAERSRRPSMSPNTTSASVVDQIITAKRDHPCWGARKLLAYVWPNGSAPVCERTAARILSRHGLIRQLREPERSCNRFERVHPNELWQMDFKGLGVSTAPL
jgi:transposase